jgi:thiamine-monophosphate kinase
MGEFAAIDAIRRSLRQVPNDAQVWIGDDAAVLPPTGGDVLLLAVDAVVAGVHADLSLTGLSDLGWKAMAASISDIAAMGADPAFALVSIAGPRGTDLELLYRGIGEAAEQFGCPVVGGDLTNAGDLVVSVTVSGTCSGKPVRRDGARPGDEVWVTGPLGASAAGLSLLRSGPTRSETLIPGTLIPGTLIPGPLVSDPLVLAHSRPVPRIAEGRAARLAGATAMIDVSDGFSADAAHIADASGVGIDLAEVPVAAGASLDEALGGGEDFELVFCAPAGARIPNAFRGLREPIRVGTCTADAPGLRLRGEPLRLTGWQHEL